MRKNDKLSTHAPRTLFIEDLGAVTGARSGYTTLALGEEDCTTTRLLLEESYETTMAIGEEDGGGTTMAYGEDSGEER